MEKFEDVVQFVNEYHFWSNAYSYRGTDVAIYKFEDRFGKVYVWKTSSQLFMDVEQEDGSLIPEFPAKGSVIKIKASIKGENDYRGEHQIVLTRVKVLEIVERALTKEEKEQKKAQEQMDSLRDGDFVYEMPYRQFKLHYADCETLAGSYNSETSTIGVIIREGRLKNSGVRFQKFNTYKFVSEDGKRIQCRYAVSEENARRRIEKELPEYSWSFAGIAY